MNSIEWKVGDIARRVSEKDLSWMPVGYAGVVTQVDESDPQQPICVDDTFWPYVVDVEKVAP